MKNKKKVIAPEPKVLGLHAYEDPEMRGRLTGMFTESDEPIPHSNFYETPAITLSSKSKTLSSPSPHKPWIKKIKMCSHYIDSLGNVFSYDITPDDKYEFIYLYDSLEVPF